jgi:hypothetical protein
MQHGLCDNRRHLSNFATPVAQAEASRILGESSPGQAVAIQSQGGSPSGKTARFSTASLQMRRFVRPFPVFG